MRVPEDRLAPIRTPTGSEPENATMQLLDQTCKSRIDRLNVAGVMGGSSGKYGNQQRFNASLRSAMSSERQKRYAVIRSADVREELQPRTSARPSIDAPEAPDGVGS